MTVTGPPASQIQCKKDPKVKLNMVQKKRENGIGKLMKNNEEEEELCSVYTENEFVTIDYPLRYSFSEYLRFYLSVMVRV
ncbi:hypothetical protein EJD97_009565 [Solanum chilense]|uniref:Uncharacterized protein n=2 Tax=Solanum subgen. Lycopersicon TaxID=49274 RepID=K4AYU7_SOLLC|nr:hypothetical protein EJD97_009565 [Solanum chilense]